MTVDFMSLSSGPMGQRVGWALLHFLWQGAVVAALLEGTLQLLRRKSAQVRYVTSCLGLAVLAILPVITAARVVPVPEMPVPAKNRMVSAQPTESVRNGGPVTGRNGVSTPNVMAPVPVHAPLVQKIIEPYLAVLVLLWLVGVIGLSLWHVLGWLVLQRLCRTGHCPTDSRLVDTFARLKRQLNMHRLVTLLESALVQTPMVVGWFRPVILLPTSALTGLTPNQVEAILAHELAHIRRWDVLVRVLQAVVETLLFFHPAVWWVSKRLQQESENCCDEMAVVICGDPDSYARALAQLAGVENVGSNLAAAASGGKLLPRLRRILGLPGESSMRHTITSAVVALSLVIGLLFTLLFSPSARGQAQSPAQTALAPSATAPTTAAAATPVPASQPLRLSLSEILDQLALTPAQRGAIQKINADADKDTRAWWSAHKTRLHELYEQREAADQAKDKEKFTMLGAQTAAEVRQPGLPKDKELADQIVALLTADQKQKFATLHGADQVRGSLHEIASAESNVSCMLCHAPLHMTSGHRGRNPLTEPAIDSPADRKGLDKFIADLKLNAQEQTAVAAAQQQAQKDAHAWWDARKDAIDKLKAEVAATGDPDGPKAEPARLEYEKLIQGAPKLIAEFPAIAAALSPERRQDYQKLVDQAHKAARPNSNCVSCHVQGVTGRTNPQP